MKRKELFPFIFLLALAFFFRFYRIRDIPFGLNNDAAWEGSAALAILGGNISSYFPYAAQGWRGEGLFRLIVALFTYFIGPNLLAIKLPSAIWGWLTIIPLYFLIRALFDQRLAFITTFFVATSGWHITMSKTGWRAIGVPLFSLATFYFLFKALKTQTKLNFILAGITLAGGLYTYDAARILPFFFTFWLVWSFLTKKMSLKTHLIGLILMSASFLLTVLPVFVYASQNWTNFTGRSNFLFVGHQIKRTSNFTPLWNNLKTTVLLFNYRASGNDFFINEPLMDKPVSWLLPIGLLIALIKIFKQKNQNYLFMLLLFLFFLIPGVLSTPNGNRGIGTLPAVYFFAAVGLLTITDFLTQFRFSQKRLFVPLTITIFLTLTTLMTYKDYLGPKRREIAGFYPETYVTLNHVNNLKNKNDYDFYFTDNYPRELLTFLLYNLNQENAFQKNYTWFKKNTDFLKISQRPKRGVAFAMFDNYPNQIVANELLRKYSQAHQVNLPYENENINKPASILIFVPKN